MRIYMFEVVTVLHAQDSPPLLVQGAICTTTGRVLAWAVGAEERWEGWTEERADMASCGVVCLTNVRVTNRSTCTWPRSTTTLGPA